MEGCSIAVGIPPSPSGAHYGYDLLCVVPVLETSTKQEVLTKQSSQAALPCGGLQREQRFKSACTFLFINYFFFFFFYTCLLERNWVR